MAIDLGKLDARIKRLQKLKELLADPDTCEALADPEIMAVIQQNVGGNGQKVYGEPEVGTLELPTEGTVIREVLDAAKRIHGNFDAKAVVSEMERGGYKFTAKTPLVAVYNVLRKLTKRKFLRVVHRGSGRSPSIFAVKD